MNNIRIRTKALAGAALVSALAFGVAAPPATAATDAKDSAILKKTVVKKAILKKAILKKAILKKAIL